MPAELSRAYVGPCAGGGYHGGWQLCERCRPTPVVRPEVLDEAIGMAREIVEVLAHQGGTLADASEALETLLRRATAVEALAVPATDAVVADGEDALAQAVDRAYRVIWATADGIGGDGPGSAAHDLREAATALRTAARRPTRPAPAPDDATALGSSVARIAEQHRRWVDLHPNTTTPWADDVGVLLTALAAARAREGEMPTERERADGEDAQRWSRVFNAYQRYRQRAFLAVFAREAEAYEAVLALRPARDGEGRGEG